MFRCKAHWASSVLVLSLALAACGGDGDSSVTEDPIASTDTEAPTDDGATPTPTTPGATTPPSDEPRSFILTVPGVPQGLDTTTLEGKPHYDLVPNWNATLVRWAELDPSGGRLQDVTEVEPMLAESWEMEPDGSFVFTLRDDVVSEYGNPLTSEDVKWSFERTVQVPDPTGRFLMGVMNVDQDNPVTVIDEHQFKLNLKAPSPLVPGLLSYAVGYTIFDSTEAQKNATSDDPWATGWMADKSANFGPYRVASFEPGTEIVLERNPGWPDDVFYDEVLIRVVADASARLQLMINGETSQTLYLDFPQVQAAENTPSLKVIAGPDTNMDNLLLNTSFEPFSLATVRRAISTALNRDEIVSSVYLGYANPALYQVNSTFNVPYQMPAIEYDVDEAQRLLTEAGYGDGFDFTLAVDPSRGDHMVSLAEIITAQLAPLGINVTIDVYASPTEFETKGRAFQHHAMLRTDRPAVADVAYKLAIYNRCEAANQYIAWCDEELETQLDAAFATPPGPDRDEIVTWLLEYVYENTIAVPIAETLNVKIFQENIVGWSADPVGATYPDRLSVE